MNIYNFLGISEKTNTVFLREIFEKVSFSYSPKLDSNLLSTIEYIVKSKILHIIEYEKNVAIKAGLAKNEEDFIDNLSRDKEWINYFFEEYPVLPDYFEKEYNKVRSLISEVLLRLSNDKNKLGIEKRTLLNLELGNGDFHNGKSTCRLYFDDGYTIYYKPRSLVVDIRLADLFKNLEGRVGKKYFWDITNIDQKSYGWSIGVPVNECSSVNDVINHFEGLGFFTAIAHALRIEDIIYDNVIATEGKLALIDLECAFCIENVINKAFVYDYNNLAGDVFRSSVITTGVIPRHTIISKDFDGESDAALSYIPYRKTVVKDFDHDREVFLIRKKEVKEKSSENHIPRINGNHVEVKDYIENFIQGFETGYNTVMQQKNQIIEFIDSFKDSCIETRVIYRPTMVYSILIEESFGIEYLQSVDKRNMLFHSLYNGEAAGVPKEIIESEISQIQQGDIPIFNKIIGESSIFNNLNTLEPYADKVDIDQVKEKIEELGEDDYDVQVNIMQKTFKIFLDYESLTDIPKFNVPKTNDIESIVSEFTRSTYTYLKKKLMIDSDTISLIDMKTSINDGWRVAPIGPGFGDGTDGIAAFLIQYGRCYNSKEAENIGRKIMRGNYNILKQWLSLDYKGIGVSHFTFSPNQFPLSTYYGTKLFKEFFSEEEHLQLDSLIYDYFKEYIDKDRFYDFIIGSCGAIFLFYQLYLKKQKQEYKEIIELCSNHLIRNAILVNDKQVCWSSNKFIELGGFSHGVSSISLALLFAHDVLKKSIYFECFEKALSYDRSFYNTSNNAYRDYRFTNQRYYAHAWAHGSGGIGLSRLLMFNLVPEYPELEKEIMICKHNLEKYINSPIYSINGGFAGNIEILRALNNFSEVNNSSLDSCVKEKIMDYLKTPKLLIRDKNHTQLLYNQGLIGLGHALLRYLFPKKTSSFLIYGVDSSFGSKYLYN